MLCFSSPRQNTFQWINTICYRRVFQHLFQFSNTLSGGMGRSPEAGMATTFSWAHHPSPLACHYQVHPRLTWTTVCTVLKQGKTNLPNVASRAIAGASRSAFTDLHKAKLWLSSTLSCLLSPHLPHSLTRNSGTILRYLIKSCCNKFSWSIRVWNISRSFIAFHSHFIE